MNPELFEKVEKIKRKNNKILNKKKEVTTFFDLRGSLLSLKLNALRSYEIVEIEGKSVSVKDREILFSQYTKARVRFLAIVQQNKNIKVEFDISAPPKRDKKDFLIGTEREFQMRKIIEK
jgi:hypothetical protein